MNLKNYLYYKYNQLFYYYNNNIVVDEVSTFDISRKYLSKMNNVQLQVYNSILADKNQSINDAVLYAHNVFALDNQFKKVKRWKFLFKILDYIFNTNNTKYDNFHIGLHKEYLKGKVWKKLSIR